MVNVGICFGGKSVEHDISVITYMQVESAIDKGKYKVVPLYLGKDNIFYMSKKLYTSRNFYMNNKLYTNKNKNILDINNKSNRFKVVNFIKKNNKVYANKVKLDCVILCVHGKGLEDGSLVSFFKVLGVPCTAPDNLTSAVFHNKYLTKAILKESKIPTLNYELISIDKWEKNKENILENTFFNNLNENNKVIIKPVNLGSSIGVKIAKNKEELEKALDYAFMFDNLVITEKCINEFREFNQAIYKYKGEIKISKIEEIKNDSNFYGFSEKYESDKATRDLQPKISQNLKVRIHKTTKRIQEIFNNKGVIRVDYLYRVSDKKLFVN